MRTVVVGLSLSITLSVLSILIIDCKSSSNAPSSPTQMILSATSIKDSVQYTFAIPTDLFASTDTLKAILTAENLSSRIDTIYTNPGFFPWGIKNMNDQTILRGPINVPLVIVPVDISPNQKVQLYAIRTPMKDSLNIPFPSGSYKLHATLDSISFALSFQVL